MSEYPMAVLVRERALDKQHGPIKSRVIEVLHKVVGIADLYAWALGSRQFDEIDPQAVKVSVANNKEATKEEVAKALSAFVGEREYECDDESDAVAVGVSWLLIQNMIPDTFQKEDTT